MLVLFVGSGIFIFLVDQIQMILGLIEGLASKANVNTLYIKTILKVIGIAYIAEFTSQISKDAGLGSMAAKVELAGKIIILAMAVPILTALVETVISMMPIN